MTALAGFCAITVVFLAARDVFVSHVRDVEVWFGFELHGALARWTAPLHWGIFALGAWGFWRAKPWITPAAAGYVFYVALSHLIWSEVSPNGRGWPAGLAQAAALSVPGWLLLRAHRARAASSAVLLVLAIAFDPIRAEQPECAGVFETVYEHGTVVREICHETGEVTIPGTDVPFPGQPDSLTDVESRSDELGCCCPPGVPLTYHAPTYPPDALHKGIEGDVFVLGAMTHGGHVRDARVTKSSPEGVFDAAALAAFSTWVYEAKADPGTKLEELHGAARICFRLPVNLSPSETRVAVFVHPPDERGGDPWTDEGFSSAIDHAKSALHDTSTCLGIRPEQARLHEAERVAITFEGRDYIFTASPTSGVGAVLIAPDRPPREVEAPTGASSLIHLLPNAAADYFDAPGCRREL